MNKDRRVRQRRGKMDWRKIGVAVVATMLVVAMVIGLIPNNTAQVLAATSDYGTETKYTESLGDNASTEYEGRIWTDKSVYSDSSKTFELYGGGTTTVTNDSDFLIAYSALATSQAVKSQEPVPLDVVFVLDMSSSMSTSMDNRQNRLYNAAEALNDSMEKLLELNDYVRVGVVAFNSTAYEILPLEHYEKVDNNKFITCSGTTITVNADGTSTDRSNYKVSSSSGTNIQKGLYDGMNMLASESSTKVTINGEEVERTPSLILLSDGQPTNASDYQAWWNIASDTNKMTPVATRSVYGMKALMTASYMRDAIDRNYGTPTVKVYSIGVGIDSLSTNDKALAYTTINPKDYLGTSTNSLVSAIRTTWDNYAANKTATVNGYTFNHPSQYDIVDTGGYSDLYYVDSYYDVDDKETMDTAFQSIVDSIMLDHAEAPTEITTDNPLTDGYITYTDPIGEYMEVKKLKSILYAGQEFKLADNYEPTTDTDGNYIYKFTGTVESSVYGNHDLSHIIIQVSADRDEIVIKIPAALIPIRVNSVELDKDGNVVTHTNNGAYPIRVLYTVGLKDGVLDADGVVTTVVSQDYIKANSNVDGTVNFYSNLYTGKTYTLPDGSEVTIGDATVEFSPAKTNPFYYVQEEMYIYTDEACTTIATGELADDTTYYYKDEFYHETNIEHTVVPRTGKQLKAVSLGQNANGEWYRTVGTPRVNRMMEFEGHKEDNTTETASEFYVPTFNTEANDILVYLGNNGVLSAKASGTLEFSKEVKAENGFTAPDKEFAFTVDLTDANGTYEYIITDADGNVIGDSDNDGYTGTVKDGDTITLKDGWTATIINLPPGAQYTVTEAPVDGFKTTVGEDDTNIASGTIAAGEVSRAAFVNTYSADPVTVDTADATLGLLGTKKLNDAWPWDEDQTFTFLIKPYGSEPLPTDSEGNDVESASVSISKGETKNFDFGKITFTEEGVYRYTVVEKEPENHEYLAGVSYSRAMYEVVVTVTDNGAGKLVADVNVQQMYDDNANQVVNDEAEEGIVFTNTYDNRTITRVPTALKAYTDNSGGNPLVDGMFEFKLTPLGVVENGSIIEGTASSVPMPEGTSGSVTVENKGTTVTFPAVNFTADDILQGQTEITFRYQMEEVIPAEAVNNVLNGMSYDATKYTIDVIVSYENGALDVEALYPNDQRIVTFNNSYTPEEAEVSLNGTKDIDGRDWIDADSFEFKLTAVTTNAPMPATDTVKVDKDVKADTNGLKAFEFDKIEYTKVGTYRYKISEVSGDANGIVTDKHECDVTVTVTDNNGKLEANVVYYGDATKTGAEFVNVYTPVFDDSTAITVSGTKVLTGKELAAGSFYFHVTPLNNAPMGSSLAANAVDADGTFQILKDVKYTVAGTYLYEVTESIPTGAVNNKYAGVTYDDSKYVIKVVVADDGIGQLTASYSIEDENGGTVNAIEFTNTYVPENTSIELPIFTKIVSGKTFNPASEKYDFVLSVVNADPVDGIQLPADTQIKNDDEGKIDFGSITFTKAGTYTVQVKEVIPENAVNNTLNGMTYDEHAITMTIHVQDNGRGRLTATYTNATGKTTFENIYEASAATLTLEGEKVLNGRNITSEDAFDFVITAVDYVQNGTVITEAAKTPSPASREVFSNGSKITFGPIVYRETGIYAYEIVEIDKDADGIVYDKGTVHAIVTVTDEGHDGQLDASVKYTKDGEGEGFQFINKYFAEHVTIGFDGKKEINNFNLQGGEFAFRLHPAETNPKADPVKEVFVANVADGTFDFGDFTYTEPGVYVYGIGEETGDIHGVDYDATLYTVTVTVTDNGKGQLIASAEVLKTSPDETKETVTMDDIVFNNIYNPDDATAIIHGYKHLEGAPMKDGQFTFEIKAKTEGAPMPQLTIVANTAAGMFHFPEIVYDVDDIDKTYEYTITEVEGNAAGYTYDKSSYVVKVTVRQDANKVLYTETEYPGEGHAVEFNNSYVPKEVTLTGELAVKAIKKLAGRDLKVGEFLFEIFGENGAPMPKDAIATNDAEGNIVFGDITFTETGVYKYTIAEKNNGLTGVTYDKTVYGVIVTVTDEGYDGQLDAEVVYVKDDKVVDKAADVVFNNTYVEPTPEEPVVPSNPSNTSPKTGDDSNVMIIALLMAVAISVISWLYRNIFAETRKR